MVYQLTTSREIYRDRIFMDILTKMRRGHGIRAKTDIRSLRKQMSYYASRRGGECSREADRLGITRALNCT